MEIVNKPIDEIIPYEFNNRIHDQTQIDRIANSINEFGFNQPIVIDENNVILVGHGRLLAARKLGKTEVPTLKKLGLKETQKKAYRILDNKLQNDSTWSFDNLDLELGFLEDNGFELEPWGLEELRDLFPVEEPEVYEDDGGGALPDETYIKRGDLIELGKHRVLCNDSTCREDVSDLMDSQTAALLFTSPPYSDMRTYGENSTDLSPDHIAKFIGAFSEHALYQAVNLGLKFEDGAIVPYWDSFIKEAADNGLKLLGWNIWHKNTGATVAAATNMFFLRHEWIFVFGEKAKSLNRTIPNKEIKSPEELAKGKKVLIRKADGKMKYTSSSIYNSHQIHSVLTINPVQTHGEHVATFPVELPSEYIKAFTKSGEIVAESFLGSGTTLIAADQLDRLCYGMEIEPKYCQVIIERYKKHCEKVGKPFECKINGEPFKPLN